MLVNRKTGFTVVILSKVGAEPVGETGVDTFDRLSKVSSTQRSTATTGIIRDHHGESGILGSGPESCFSQSRMANDCHAFGIDSFFIRQIGERLTQPPGPGTKGTPFIGCRRRLPLPVEK